MISTLFPYFLCQWSIPTPCGGTGGWRGGGDEGGWEAEGGLTLPLRDTQQ